MTQNFFIRTSAGIINRDAVSFVRITAKGSVFVFMHNVSSEEYCNPIFLYGTEAIEFLRLFQPLIDVRGKDE